MISCAYQCYPLPPQASNTSEDSEALSEAASANGSNDTSEVLSEISLQLRSQSFWDLFLFADGLSTLVVVFSKSFDIFLMILLLFLARSQKNHVLDEDV